MTRGRQRNWKVVGLGALILFAVGVFVFGHICVSNGGNLPHPRPRSAKPRQPIQGKPSIDFSEFVNDRYTAKSFNGTWISDSEILYRGSQVGEVMLMDLKTRRARTLVQNEALVPATIVDVVISPDRKFLLASHTHQRLFRNAQLARYDIINLDTMTSVPLANGLGHADHDVLQLATWAPRGNALVYVYRNNIYYRPDAQEVTEFAITSSGIPGFIYNGVLDWEYNEQSIIRAGYAVWFSPDGRRLAYASFNDTLVPIMPITFYGPPGNLEYQYPKTVKMRCPKPGRTNPVVELSVVNLESFVGGSKDDVRKVLPPDDLIYSEPILTAVTWPTNTELSSVWMNRVQNRARVLVCDATTDAETAPCREVHKRQERAGWVEIFTPKFDALGERFLLILPHEVGNSGPYKHVAMVHPGGVTPLTTGRFVVTGIVSWDEQEKLVYFMATAQDDPSTVHFYSVSDDERSAPHRASCISCSVQPDCLYSKASFSVNHTYFMFRCAGPHIPEVAIYTKRNELVMLWERNDKLRSALYGRALPKPFRLEVEVPGGFKAQVKLLLPPDMDYSGKTKYPLIVEVYAGVRMIQVSERFMINWGSYLSVNRSFIYATIDGRGSGHRGDRMTFTIYKRFGTVEIEDQISVTKYIQDNFSYVDRNRTAIWGWSYGGYATSMVMAKDTGNVFQCGIANGGVTNWIYYDSMMTERCMGLPTVDDNLQGYINADVTNKVENFRNKRFLLVHGTLDDNVHFQHAMMLARALQLHDIPFHQQIYPDEVHPLNGIKSHLYHTFEAFLDDCLRLH